MHDEEDVGVVETYLKGEYLTSRGLDTSDLESKADLAAKVGVNEWTHRAGHHLKMKRQMHSLPELQQSVDSAGTNNNLTDSTMKNICGE